MTLQSTSVTQITSEVVRNTQPGSVFSLFLDFDGTLVPIATDPTAPQLNHRTRDTLARVSRKTSCVTTIISGRAIDDIYRRVRMQSLVYAGNHGLEIRGPDFHFVEPGAAALRDRLEQLSAQLTVALQKISGALVEYKSLTTSVHYRMVADHDVSRVEAMVRASVARDGTSFRLNTGKKVLEIVPRSSWNKGTAARWINRHLGLDETHSIFIGDDVTDEDAFSVLTQAITVRVGDPGITHARYHLPDPEAVNEFLDWMADFDGRS